MHTIPPFWNTNISESVEPVEKGYESAEEGQVAHDHEVVVSGPVQGFHIVVRAQSWGLSGDKPGARCSAMTDAV